MQWMDLVFFGGVEGEGHKRDLVDTSQVVTWQKTCPPSLLYMLHCSILCY